MVHCKSVVQQEKGKFVMKSCICTKEQINNGSGSDGLIEHGLERK